MFLLIPTTYIYYQISVFKVEKIFIKQNKEPLKEKLRLIQISDYHNNNLINKERLIRTIEKLDPDFIVLTGDIIDSETDNFDKTIGLLSDIKQVNKNIYYISGNHERANKKKEEFMLKMKDIGICSLDNKYKTLDIGKNKINLCGIPFGKVKHEEDIWSGLSKDLFTILLAHSPKKAMEYKELESNLILSGHIHGGQVRLPFIGALASPEGGVLPKYNKGLYELANRKLYIDSGLGNSVAPIRTFNRVQISYIEIE